MEGALLVLPNGAARQDLFFLNNIQEYARRNVLSWFLHVHGTLGLEAEAGPLYLVTGHDKCENWCVGSYTNLSTDIGLPLSFTPHGINDGGIVLYSPADPGSIDTRAFAEEEGNSANQCIFIRGYKMTLCKSLLERIVMGPVKITDIVPPKPENVAEGGWGSISRETTFGRLFSWFSGDNRGGGQQQQLKHSLGTVDDKAIVESFPHFPEVIFLVVH